MKIKRILLSIAFFTAVIQCFAIEYLKVGQEKTLYFPSEITGKVLAGVPACVSTQPMNVAIVSTTLSGVTVRALKPVSGTPCTINVRYYYRELDPVSGQYIYQRTGSYNFYVYVEANEVESISVKPKEMVFDGFSRCEIYTEITPKDAETTYTWSSSDKNVAVIASYGATGTILAVGPGRCEITVRTSNGKTASCKVTVPGGQPTKVELQQSLSLTKGESYKLTPTLTPSGTSTDYTWKSSNPSIASVSSSGEVTALNEGTATITVTTSNNLTANCQVTVNESPVVPEKVSIPESVTIAEGYSYAIVPSLFPQNAETSYTWTSSDNNVATISSDGKIFGQKAGEATITVATDNGKKGQCKISIVTPPEEGNARNIQTRIQKIKAIVRRTIENR